MPSIIHRNALLLILAITQSSAFATDAHEQIQLSLILQQLDTIKRVATQAEAASPSEPDARYRFDYPQLLQDIQRIRHGVRGYQFPTRAQPRDPSQLIGDYRLDTPSAESSP